MEFKQLEAFVAVVDYGSFSEAARKLYLTQPTISTHIRSPGRRTSYPADHPHDQKTHYHAQRLSALRQCRPYAGYSQ